MWDALPWELRVRIAAMARRERAAIAVQRTWSGYRTRVLMGRFRMLRYLREFRTWNPTLSAFLSRARL